MKSLTESVMGKLRFTQKDFSFHSTDHFRDTAAEQANKKADPIILALCAVADRADEIKWLNECKCDVAWTGRGKHEPNTTCGELDYLVDALADLRKLVE